MRICGPPVSPALAPASRQRTTKTWRLTKHRPDAEYWQMFRGENPLYGVVPQRRAAPIAIYYDRRGPDRE